MAKASTTGQNWFGKVKGHVGEAKGRLTADARQRDSAERAKNSTILTEQMLKSGMDAGKVLYTTFRRDPDGRMATITADDLATFRHNMTLAKQQAGFTVGGITARQVIDLASAAPLGYKTAQPNKAQSDIDKAKREITHAVAASAFKGEVRFITNAGEGSKAGRHHVTIEFSEFKNAVDAIIAAGDDPKAPRRAADQMRKGKLKFDCDCERHRYFLRYVATIGGFNAGRDETGFPKIRNPNLSGVACKHVLRAITELESSGVVLRFLERHLVRQVSAEKGRMQTKQKEAEAALKAKKQPTRIKTSKEREAEAKLARDRRKFAREAKAAASKSLKSAQPASRRAAKSSDFSDDELAQRFDMDVAGIRALSAKARAALEKDMRESSHA